MAKEIPQVINRDKIATYDTVVEREKHGSFFEVHSLSIPQIYSGKKQTAVRSDTIWFPKRYKVADATQWLVDEQQIPGGRMVVLAEQRKGDHSPFSGALIKRGDEMPELFFFDLGTLWIKTPEQKDKGKLTIHNVVLSWPHIDGKPFHVAIDDDTTWTSKPNETKSLFAAFRGSMFAGYTFRPGSKLLALPEDFANNLSEATRYASFLVLPSAMRLADQRTGITDALVADGEAVFLHMPASCGKVASAGGFRALF